MSLKIALAHPGHAMSTAWLYDGYLDSLTLDFGVDVLECRTDKLISAAHGMLESSKIIHEGDQGASLNQWKLHLGQQLAIIRLLECSFEAPDLTLFISGRIFSAQNQRLLDFIPGNKVVMLTESPYEDETQAVLAQHFDFATANDPSSLAYLNQFVPTVYQPHGYDDDVYRPGEHEDKYDVSFVGTPFGNRKPILEAVKQAGLRHFIFDQVVMEIEDEGHKQDKVVFMPPHVTAKIYHQAKVNLNIHRTEKYYAHGEHIDYAYSIGPRAFDIAGSGEFQLCDDSRPELKEIFGDTVATYHQPEEVVDAVRYWIDPARDAQRKEMALASHDIAIGGHTYTHRTYQLVQQLATWYNQPEWVKGIEEYYEKQQG